MACNNIQTKGGLVVQLVERLTVKVRRWMQGSKKDLYGNACIGQDINLFETHNCMVHTTQEKKVVIQGLDGYIVAENNDTLLICKLSEEQRIKQFSGQDK